MKKLLTCFTLILCVLLLISCEQSFGNQKYINNLLLSPELEESFMGAFLNAALEEEKSFDINKIEISNYFGKIGEIHIVEFNRSCPGKKQYATIENMIFNSYSSPVYLIYNGTLYSVEEAYNQKLINFDNLCMLFGIESSGIPTFNKEDYEKLDKQFKEIQSDKYELYELMGYYGKYNGYSLVNYNYRGMQLCVTATETCDNLAFTHGYASGMFWVMNGENSYSLNQAFDKGILTKKDIIDIFEIYTGSASLNQILLDSFASCVAQKCGKKLIGNTIGYNLLIEKYYGSYQNLHVFDVTINSYYLDETNKTSDDIKSLYRLFGRCVYDGKDIYKINEALELGIITEEIISKLK